MNNLEFKQLIHKLTNNRKDLYYMCVGYLDGIKGNEKHKDVDKYMKEFVHSGGKRCLLN